MADAEGSSPPSPPGALAPASLVPVTQPALTPPIEKTMDVHAPEHPVRTRRDFFKHIAIVTVGILIALALEAVVEGMHHRSLVRTARANLAQEIRDNHAKLTAFVGTLDTYEKQREIALQFADDMLSRQRSDITGFSLDFGAIHLNAAAWQTANATGALGHMPYALVQKFAEAYDKQRRFDDIMNDSVKDYATAGNMPSPKAENARALDEWRLRLQTNRGSLRLQRGYAKSLDEAYTSALAR